MEAFQILSTCYFLVGFGTFSTWPAFFVRADTDLVYVFVYIVGPDELACRLFADVRLSGVSVGGARLLLFFDT